MRPRVEAGGFELLTDVGKCRFRLIRERHTASADQSIDVVHAKANAFHVKRANGNRERLAFFENSVPRRALRLVLNTGHQPLQAVFGGFSVIYVGGHLSCL